MNMKSMTVLCAASAMTCAAVATAQTSVDRSFKAVSKDCSGIQWSQEILAQYPTIGSACQGVEERNGKTYVKFQGTVNKIANKGQQLVVDFKGGGQVALTPPADMSLYIRGQKTSVSKLGRGDELTFYVAEDRVAAQFPDNPEPEIRTARLIIVPILLEEERLAALPATASNWPLVALGGMMMLGFGGFLSWSRRSR